VKKEKTKAAKSDLSGLSFSVSLRLRG
jgi:hypothetical protein